MQSKDKPVIKIIENANIVEEETYINIFSNSLFSLKEKEDNEEDKSINVFPEFKIDGDNNLMVIKTLYGGNQDNKLADDIQSLSKWAEQLNTELNKKNKKLTHKTIMDIYDLYANFRWQCAKIAGLIDKKSKEHELDDIYNYHKYKSDVESIENYSLFESIIGWIDKRWKDIKTQLSVFIKKLTSNKSLTLQDINQTYKNASNDPNLLNENESDLQSACKRQLALLQANEVFFKNLLLKSYNQTFLDKFNGKSINDILQNSKEFQVKYIDNQKLSQANKEGGCAQNTFSIEKAPKFILKQVTPQNNNQEGNDILGEIHWEGKKIADIKQINKDIKLVLADKNSKFQVTYKWKRDNSQSQQYSLYTINKNGVSVGAIKMVPKSHQDKTKQDKTEYEISVVSKENKYFVKTGKMFLNSESFSPKSNEYSQEVFKGNYEQNIDTSRDLIRNVTLIDQASAGCFMSAVDKFLGFNVLVDTELAVTSNGYAVLMEQSDGESACSVIDDSKNILDGRGNPQDERFFDWQKYGDQVKTKVNSEIKRSCPSQKLQESIIMLNILDYICGNRDRHTENFFVNKNGLKGIDNEWCMPLENQTIDYQYNDMKFDEHLSDLIPVVTQDIKDRVETLIDERGNLNPEIEKLAKIFIKTKSGEDLNSVINSMKQRISNLKKHLNSEKVQVINNDSQFSKETAKKIFNGSTKYKACSITTMGAGIVFAGIKQINQMKTKNNWKQKI